MYLYSTLQSYPKRVEMLALLDCSRLDSLKGMCILFKLPNKPFISVCVSVKAGVDAFGCHPRRGRAELELSELCPGLLIQMHRWHDRWWFPQLMCHSKQHFSSSANRYFRPFHSPTLSQPFPYYLTEMGG